MGGNNIIPLPLYEGEGLNIRIRIMGKTLKKVLQEFAYLNLMLVVEESQVYFRWIVTPNYPPIILIKVEINGNLNKAVRTLITDIYEKSVRAAK